MGTCGTFKDGKTQFQSRPQFDIEYCCPNNKNIRRNCISRKKRITSNFNFYEVQKKVEKVIFFEEKAAFLSQARIFPWDRQMAINCSLVITPFNCILIHTMAAKRKNAVKNVFDYSCHFGQNSPFIARCAKNE